MRTPDRSIFITGLGAVSPLGMGVPAYVAGLRAGRSGIAPLDVAMEGRARIRSVAAAQCRDFNPLSAMDESDARRLPRLVPMALAAAREALTQAELLEALRIDPGAQSPQRDFDQAELEAPRHPAWQVGLILGTGAGGIDFTLDQARLGYAPGANVGSADGLRSGLSLWTITNATHGNLAGELSIRLGLHGPSWCVSTGCASSSDAIGLAMETLRSDRPGAPDAMVVVGADAHIRWETLAGMELLRVISTRDFGAAVVQDAPTASRPFDRTRDGFILGEGAWAIVLERPAFSRQRGHAPIARAVGYGATCDAFHRVRPDPDMRDSARAMRLALLDAHIEPAELHALHYHGTGTRLNDALETQAVKLAFGDHARRLAGHSVKGAIGHPQGACGAAAVVATLGSLRGLDDGAPFLPPTVNLREPDIEGGCDLDYTPRAARAAEGARMVMVNCLAFGAKNSALVFDAGPPADQI